ncbi:DnaT-like ssDNA-binding protein [Sphingobium sp. UBA5915]|uniref:DnaT-like ssDNA-binding protein n=1 Tax=Sphingobium sp. UBA5915 TaxID=1947530 RepID=UPI0025E123D0|nr:DnaT-like ssDNA-binding protein [Sphingobium sp. UBA5915]
MGLETTGSAANSWQTIVQANQFLTDFVHPLLGVSPELSNGDEPYLIEAAKEISRMWSFKGQPVEPLQTLAWPRKGVVIEGKTPGSDWYARNFPHLDPGYEEYVRFLHFDSPGISNAPTLLPNDVVPNDILEAQAILAAFKVRNITLWQDNAFNASELKLDGVGTIKPANAVAATDAVFMRLARWGSFRGVSIVRPGGAR